MTPPPRPHDPDPEEGVGPPQLDLTQKEEEDLLAALRRVKQSAREVTLEEWIAAGQACCGVDHDEDDGERRGLTPPSDPSPQTGDSGTASDAGRRG